MWHVSIAKWKSDLIPTDRWGDGTKREAMRIAGEVLHGVGQGASVELWSPVCVHVRRALCDAEMAMLSAEWLAIPARDEFAPEQGMETRL